jgi:hypothetical protein
MLWKKFLALGAVGFVVLAAAGAAIYLVIVNARLRALQEQKDKAVAAALDAKAAELQAIKGIIESQRAIMAGLTGSLKVFATEMAKIDKRATVAEHSRTEATIHDTIPGVVVTPTPEQEAGGFRPEWHDAYHRFKFTLPAGPLDRKQLFRLEGVVVRGVKDDRFERVTFEELDPKTHEPIPLADGSVELSHDFRFTKEEPPQKVFHPRVVAAVDHMGEVGGGVQLLSWRSVNLSVVGLYNIKTKQARGALAPTWRLRFPWFDSTLAIGPYGGVSTDGKLVGGAVATLELTR